MRNFEHVNAKSFEEASKILAEANGKADAMSGGSDLMGVYKDSILETSPEIVVNLKQIPDYGKIEIKSNELVLGAGATLSKVAEIKEYPAVAEAAYSVASPVIRPLATVGGNICQDVRCWYYRYPNQIGGRLDCYRKGGNECFAIRGENRYHSVFGGKKAHITPCASECPGNTDISAYMARIREGDYDGAAEIVMQYNPMPAVTSRVCAHFCESACNRLTTDESVSVHDVERSLGDYIMQHADKFYRAPAKTTGKRVALVGSGPAGLAAAYYLRRAGHDVTVYDRMEEAGGCLRYAIPEYRLPKHYIKDVIQAWTNMGVKFELGKELGEDIDPEKLEKQYDKVFYATGAWKRPVLGFDGEELTEFGLQFLTEVNMWINKKERSEVFVMGGGNVAMDVAMTVHRLGAKKVALACLEQRHEMPASAEEVARAEEEGITVMNGWGISRVIYEGKKVKGIEIVKCTSVFDDKQRFSPQYDQNIKQVIDSDSILLATGQAVDLSFLGEAYLEKTGRGLIKADEETGRTSRENVYAGGDAATGPATVIKAIQTGRNSAKAINSEFGIAPGKLIGAEEFVHFDREGIRGKVPNKAKDTPVAERSLTKEDSETLPRELAMKEAERCMNCACYSVNASDLATVLVVMDASIVTTERTVGAEEFLCSKLMVCSNLKPGELVKEIHIPQAKGVAHYDKNRVRNAIDFATVGLATRFVVEKGIIKEARVVFGAVAPVPYPMPELEAFLIGKPVNEATAHEAAEMCVKGTEPMEKNEPKLFVMKSLMKKAILRLQ